MVLEPNVDAGAIIEAGEAFWCDDQSRSQPHWFLLIALLSSVLWGAIAALVTPLL